jgi:hypothetical protein
MEAICSPKTMGTTYKITWHNNSRRPQYASETVITSFLNKYFKTGHKVPHICHKLNLDIKHLLFTEFSMSAT